MFEDLKEQVLTVARRGLDLGLVVGSSGNYSLYDAAQGEMLITASGVSYYAMKVDDIICMSLEGKVSTGKGKPSSEWRMHSEIYRARQEVRAVVHTHSPHASALAVLRQELPEVLVETILVLGGAVPVVDFAYPGSLDLATKAAVALQKANACLLANHGAVTVGRDLDEAFARAVSLEEAAKIYGLALSWGIPHHISPEAIRQMLLERQE